MSTGELFIAPLTVADIPELVTFMRTHGGADTDAQHLHHWYFGNPSGSSTVVLGRMDGRIVGMATTNDHRFIGPDGAALVGMPQKVLTDAGLRGKGIFGKLYHASEQAGRAKGIGFFLTVTNAASTPIFLQKFGYVRLPVPRAIAFAPAFGALKGVVNELPWPGSVAPATACWAMEKGAAHLHWRHDVLPGQGHRHLRFDAAQGAGHIVVRRIRKKGLPVLLLLDLVANRPGSERFLLKQARRVAGKSGCFALIALATHQVHAASPGSSSMDLSSGFNLLVKGLDPAHTARLAQQRFELAFGDLDFL